MLMWVRELFNISFPIHYDDTLFEAMVRGTYQERELVSVVAECMVGVVTSSRIQL